MEEPLLDVFLEEFYEKLWKELKVKSLQVFLRKSLKEIAKKNLEEFLSQTLEKFLKESMKKKSGGIGGIIEKFLQINFRIDS